MIDDPIKNDNQNYDYTSCETHVRPEYPVILEMVKPNSTVVDFGCGNGSLLSLLKAEKKIEGLGYDISPSGVEICKKKGLDAVCESIDRRHPGLKDNQFDYAICNVTIQMVMYPKILLEEMIRVSNRQIISFPNFAYFRNRIDLFFLRPDAPSNAFRLSVVFDGTYPPV